MLECHIMYAIKDSDVYAWCWTGWTDVYAWCWSSFNESHYYGSSLSQKIVIVFHVLAPRLVQLPETNTSLSNWKLAHISFFRVHTTTKHLCPSFLPNLSHQGSQQLKQCNKIQHNPI